MFEGKRAAKSGIQVLTARDDPEITTGGYFLTLSARLCLQDFPPERPGQWVDWVPKPEFESSNEDARTGDNFFFGALGWITRHKIAHVFLQHSVVPDSVRAEIDADRQATLWLRGDLKADHDRTPGTRPDKTKFSWSSEHS